MVIVYFIIHWFVWVYGVKGDLWERYIPDNQKDFSSFLIFFFTTIIIDNNNYPILVYTWSWTITNPEFWLASQPWTIRNSPWLTKMKKKNKMAENFCKEFCKNKTSQEQKKTTK